MRSPLSKLSAEALDEMTETMSDAQISAIYGLTRTAATYARKRLGIQSYAEKHGKRVYRENYLPKPGAKRAFSFRRSGADERYFQQLSTPRQAYWLGLLLADGWIVTEKGAPTGFAIALNERDKQLLETFARDLGCPTLLRRERSNSALLQIKLTSAEVATDLIKLGMVPKKSKVLELPEVSAELTPHLLRGYYDGDGSIHVRKNSLSIQLTSGSEKMLRQVQEHLLQARDIGSTISKDRDSFVFRCYAGNAISFGNYIYGMPPHSEISMERKQKKFFDYLGSGAGRSWERLLSDKARLGS